MSKLETFTVSVSVSGKEEEKMVKREFGLPENFIFPDDIVKAAAEFEKGMERVKGVAEKLSRLKKDEIDQKIFKLKEEAENLEILRAGYNLAMQL